jgi:hypothetical protein
LRSSVPERAGPEPHAEILGASCMKMVLQVAVRDIGQLTDF